ncbi:hypothetical protein [Streptomyces mirabilis]|uniref:hypothetical protein n=1 Tax=Streptomyces mirabilis TaxID=68239 RepID=UPI0036767C46
MLVQEEATARLGLLLSVGQKVPKICAAKQAADSAHRAAQPADRQIGKACHQGHRILGQARPAAVMACHSMSPCGKARPGSGRSAQSST